MKTIGSFPKNKAINRWFPVFWRGSFSQGSRCGKELVDEGVWDGFCLGGNKGRFRVGSASKIKEANRKLGG